MPTALTLRRLEATQASGHDFNSLLKKSRQCAVLKGHGFIRADKPIRMSAALAAEGWFYGSALRNVFSTSCSVMLIPPDFTSTRSHTSIRA
jgi:hypothetical protein